MSVRLYRNFCQKNSPIVKLAAEDEDTHYLKNVLRSRIGDKIILFNEKEGECIYTILSFDPKKEGYTLEFSHIKRKPVLGSPLYLIMPLLKGDTMGWIIEKATELGVTHFYFITTDHCQNYPLNIRKMQKQIKNALQQCERFQMPQITEAGELSVCVQNLLTKSPFPSESSKPLLIAGLERSQSPSLLSCMHLWAQKKDDALQRPLIKGLIIGPEGGFSPREQKWLKSSYQQGSIQLVSFGDFILRAETAALMGLSVLSVFEHTQ